MESQSHTILAVDDNPRNLKILYDILSPEYAVTCVPSGQECLEVAPRLEPDLILLDVMMEGLDGYETCATLRKMPAMRSTKIVMVSAKAMVAERMKGYDVGADDYVTKPFNYDELLAKVRVFLSLKSATEVNQLKSNILTLLNHETRTPLNGILGPAELLRDSSELSSEERAALLGMILQNASRLETLFERVFLLSTLKSGKVGMQVEQCDMWGLVKRTAYTVRQRYPRKNVEFAADMSYKGKVAIDPARFSIVIDALLDNAVQYSPEDKKVVIRMWRAGKTINLSVTDFGPGIEKENLSLVFQEFMNPDVLHHTRGHGLSLAISKEIVRAHGGTIAVESSPGVKTAFTIELPIGIPHTSGSFSNLTQ